jgi:hypothetical protein
MNALWVDASRYPRIPGTPVHASALTPIIFLVLHISWFTLGLVLLVAVGVIYLTVRRLSLMWAVRMLKSKLRGKRVSARPLMYRRRCQLVNSYGDCDMNEFR